MHSLVCMKHLRKLETVQMSGVFAATAHTEISRAPNLDRVSVVHLFCWHETKPGARHRRRVGSGLPKGGLNPPVAGNGLGIPPFNPPENPAGLVPST